MFFAEVIGWSPAIILVRGPVIHAAPGARQKFSGFLLDLKQFCASELMEL
jgi:hypothetical protein